MPRLCKMAPTSFICYCRLCEGVHRDQTLLFRRYPNVSIKAKTNLRRPCLSLFFYSPMKSERSKQLIESPVIDGRSTDFSLHRYPHPSSQDVLLYRILRLPTDVGYPYLHVHAYSYPEGIVYVVDSTPETLTTVMTILRRSSLREAEKEPKERRKTCSPYTAVVNLLIFIGRDDLQRETPHLFIHHSYAWSCSHGLRGPSQNLKEKNQHK